MLPVVAGAVFLLMTCGVYLVLERSLLRVVLGLACVSHAVHLLLLASGRWGSRPPIVDRAGPAGDLSDPVPQAFVLTAIVISMAFTLYLLAGMARQARLGRGAELAPPPDGDGERPEAEVRRELEGRPDA